WTTHICGAASSQLCSRNHRSLNQALRETELGAEFLFAARHFAFVGFVVVTSQMEKAVKHKDLDLDREGMVEFVGLALRSGNADGQIAGNFEWAGGTGR